MSSMQEELNELFADLVRVRSEATRVVDCDEVARLVLKILSCLLDDRDMSSVAKHLSLFVERTENAAPEIELAQSLSFIDQDLDEDLRGFSNLMELILQEGSVRRDVHYFLHRVPNIDPELRNEFTKLTSAITAYFELDEAFILDRSESLTVIFLMGVNNILGQDDLLGEWIIERVKTTNLCELYFFVRTADIWPTPACSYAKEIAIILLCYKIARDRSISALEANSLDHSLKAVGMMGVTPLTDAGFLKINDRVRKNINVQYL